jgi:hypothetical protein
VDRSARADRVVSSTSSGVIQDVLEHADALDPGFRLDSDLLGGEVWYSGLSAWGLADAIRKAFLAVCGF